MEGKIEFDLIENVTNKDALNRKYTVPLLFEGNNIEKNQLVKKK